MRKKKYESEEFKNQPKTVRLLVTFLEYSEEEKATEDELFIMSIMFLKFMITQCKNPWSMRDAVVDNLNDMSLEITIEKDE